MVDDCPKSLTTKILRRLRLWPVGQTLIRPTVQVELSLRSNWTSDYPRHEPKNRRAADIPSRATRSIIRRLSVPINPSLKVSKQGLAVAEKGIGKSRISYLSVV